MRVSAAAADAVLRRLAQVFYGVSAERVVTIADAKVALPEDEHIIKGRTLAAPGVADGLEEEEAGAGKGQGQQQQRRRRPQPEHQARRQQQQQEQEFEQRRRQNERWQRQQELQLREETERRREAGGEQHDGESLSADIVFNF